MPTSSAVALAAKSLNKVIALFHWIIKCTYQYRVTVRLTLDLRKGNEKETRIIVTMIFFGTLTGIIAFIYAINM